MTDRIAFVTGTTGFLGQNLCEQLAEAGGWRIVGLYRNTEDTALFDKWGVELVQGDIRDPDSLTRTMPDNVDAVFHMAAMTTMWRKQAAEQEAVNVDGTRNVIAAALSKGAGRLIHTSTWNVFDWSSSRISEETPRTGAGSWIGYDRSKDLAENAVHEAIAADDLDAVIMNPSHILGRYDRNNWARLVALAAIGKLPGVPPGAGDFAHGEAVARGHIAAVDLGRSGENYLLAGPHMSFLELVSQVARMAGQRKVPSKPVPGVVLGLLGRFEQAVSGMTGRMPNVTPEAAALVTANITSVSTKARDELGYDAPEISVALNDCYKWLMKAGIIKTA